MPTGIWGYGCTNNSGRIKAWTLHYMAKGCSNTKANAVAYRKVRRSRTWPPGH